MPTRKKESCRLSRSHVQEVQACTSTWSRWALYFLFLWRSEFWFLILNCWRGSGGRGFISGAGETELPLQRRRIIKRRKQLLSKIKVVRRTSALQRASRKGHGSEDCQTMPIVAVVGYTNAHVLDARAPNLDDHMDTVLQVLQQVGVPEKKLKNMIEVWNKIDLQDEMAADTYLDDGEVTDSTFEQSFEEAIDDFGDNNEDKLSSRDEIETVEEEYSDNWILSEDEEEKTLNKMGWLTSSDQKTKSPEELRKDKITPYSHSSPHVNTSVLMGMGLYELLELIDDRLKCEIVVKSNVLDRKWRPLV